MHYTTVWWPTSRFMVAGTSYTRHSQLLSKKNVWNEKVAKEPKSSQIKLWANCFWKKPNFWILAPKEPILQPCLRPTTWKTLVVTILIDRDLQPSELRHKGVTLSLAHCAMEPAQPGDVLHSALTCPSANTWHFKSRHPFGPAAQQLISSSDDNVHRSGQITDGMQSGRTTSPFFIPVVNKFCSQHDLTNIPVKSVTEQKVYDRYAAKGIKENAVSNSYETTCMLSSKAMILW